MLSDKDAKADGAPSRLLQGFDLAEVDERREFVAFVDDGFGIGGPGLECLRKYIGGELFQVRRHCRC